MHHSFLKICKPYQSLVVNKSSQRSSRIVKNTFTRQFSILNFQFSIFTFPIKKNILLFCFGILLSCLWSCKKKEIIPIEIIPPPPPIPCEFISFKMNGTTCALDTAARQFYFSINKSEMEFAPFIEITEKEVTTFIDNNEITNFTNNDLGTVKTNEPLPVRFVFCDSSEINYELVFTRFPIIQLHTNNQFIHSDPKTAISFRLNDPDFEMHGMPTQEFSSVAGIEIRGGAAQIYPKKSYGLSLWKDSLGIEKIDAPLLGMRDDDDWILDAMFIDKARMRNRTTTDLWLDFSELPYQDDEPKAKSGTHGKFVEVFLDNEYWGIYAFTERMDRKLLQLKKYENTSNFGLLYKGIKWANGTVRFENYFDFDPYSSYWEGWQQKYPDAETEGIYWEPLADFTKFVIESSDSLFQAEVGNYLHLDNAADYYILLNLMRGDDNTGKNIYMAKRKLSNKFFIVPWDMDGTWGRLGEGSPTSSTGILSNNLFDRLIETDVENFKSQLKQRWAVARNNIFTKSNLMNYFEKYATNFEEQGIFERENERWDLDNTVVEEMDYIDTWLGNRLSYLDDYFSNL